MGVKEEETRHFKTESSTSPRGVGLDKTGVVNTLNTLMTSDGYDKAYGGIPEVRVEGDEDIVDRRQLALTASTDYGSISTHKFLQDSRNSCLKTKNPIDKRKQKVPD